MKTTATMLLSLGLLVQLAAGEEKMDLYTHLAIPKVVDVIRVYVPRHNTDQSSKWILSKSLRDRVSIEDICSTLKSVVYTLPDKQAMNSESSPPLYRLIFITKSPEQQEQLGSITVGKPVVIEVRANSITNINGTQIHAFDEKVVEHLSAAVKRSLSRSDASQDGNSSSTRNQK